MFSGSSELPQNSLQIKQDDKFFSRLLSKESSRANPSLRVYYGGASGAVPFTWESRPGTPKHALSDTVLPPLTPPPAYHSISKKKPIKNHSRSTLLHALFLKISPKKTHNVSPYPSPSSWRSSSSDSSPAKYHGRRRFFSQSSSSFDSREDDDEGETVGSPTSTLCFGSIAGRVTRARGGGRRCCYWF
jgi:hypothetical protein